MQTETDPRTRVYKVEEVARHILRCDPATVYRLINDGRLECIRLGRVIRVTQAQVNAFLGE